MGLPVRLIMELCTLAAVKLYRYVRLYECRACGPMHGSIFLYRLTSFLLLPFSYRHCYLVVEEFILVASFAITFTTVHILSSCIFAVIHAGLKHLMLYARIRNIHTCVHYLIYDDVMLYNPVT